MSASASLVSWLGGSELAALGEDLGPDCPPYGLGVEVVGRGHRLGFFGQFVRLTETPQRVLRLGESGQQGGENPAFPYRAQRIAAFL